MIIATSTKFLAPNRSTATQDGSTFNSSVHCKHFSPQFAGHGIRNLYTGHINTLFRMNSNIIENLSSAKIPFMLEKIATKDNNLIMWIEDCANSVELQLNLTSEK